MKTVFESFGVRCAIAIRSSLVHERKDAVVLRDEMIVLGDFEIRRIYGGEGNDETPKGGWSSINAV
jgi:hypothetical protein